MTLKFGIIGAGNIAPVHAVAIQNIHDADLAAVADTNQENARALADRFGGEVYSDYHEMLARSDIDVITLCVPHYLHCPIALEAAAAGKHILCEKPMAISLNECDAMLAACNKAGITLGIISQGRFEPLALQLKNAIDSGVLGRLLWVSANVLWHRTEEYYKTAPWRGTWDREGGGVLINQAIHALDLLLWFAGVPARVTAQIRTLNHQIEVEDCAVASLEYEKGWMGLVQATTNAIPGYPERIEIYGTQGSAIYHKGRGQLEWHFLDASKDHLDTAEVNSGAARPMDISPAAHIAQFQDFAEALRHHSQPKITGRDGRLSVELVEAIYRSSRTKTSINLPLLEGN